MLRYGFSAVALLGLAIGAVACGVSGENTSSSTSNATATVPLHCEGVTGIEKLGLRSGALANIGFAGERAYLTTSTSCQAVKLDGSDPQTCASTDKGTVPQSLLGQDAEYIYFRAHRLRPDANRDVLIRVRKADGVAEDLFDAQKGSIDNATLAGDALLWSVVGERVLSPIDGSQDLSYELWSMPKAGGKATKLFTQVDNGERGAFDGAILGIDVLHDHVLTQGHGGLRLLRSSLGVFESIDPPKIVPLAGDDHADVREAALTTKSITVLEGKSLWSLDRTSGAPTQIGALPAKMTVRRLAADGETPVMHIDDLRAADKPAYAFVRLAAGKLETLIASNLSLGAVVRDGAVVIWSVKDTDDKLTYFTAPAAQYGKAPIECSNLPLVDKPPPAKDAGAPAEAGTTGDDDDDDTSTVDAGTKKDPKPVPAGDDDDDIQTSTDPTEPDDEKSSNDESQPGTTAVTINSACASVPGPAAGSPAFALLGLALLGLRRRRR